MVQQLLFELFKDVISHHCSCIKLFFMEELFNAEKYRRLVQFYEKELQLIEDDPLELNGIKSIVLACN